MEKKKRISKPDINEIAFRVVQESTSEDNLCELKTINQKPLPSLSLHPNNICSN
jgi:hypothetical protein